jgi:hypothetical protein
VRYFAFGHESEEQLEALAGNAVGLMFGVIKPLGLLLATMPVGDGYPGATAGANFQLAYRSSFLLPHRRVAWIRFVERLDEAATFAEDVRLTGNAEVVMKGVIRSLRTTMDRLAAHIEPVERSRPV